MNRIPKPVLSALKLFAYVAAIGVVTYINDPAVLAKIGVTGAIATVVAGIVKGALTWLTLRRTQAEQDFFGGS